MRKGICAAVFIVTSGLAAVSLPGIAFGQAATPAAGEMKMEHPAKTVMPAGPLKISFDGKSAEWTVATLASLPHVTVKVYNEHAKADQTYSGVPLATLLTKLGVPEKPHGKEFRLYLVAEGADGYQVVYSVGEVTPDVHDGTTLVADTLDGKPLSDSGPLQLVTTGEKRPARWVRNLAAIRVMTAQ
jgi:Oxidoreductase molybdopterin binding domain